jgi:hypothetical protein
MRISKLLLIAVAVCASGSLAPAALAQPNLVAIDTGKTIEFVPEADLIAFGDTLRASARPTLRPGIGLAIDDDRSRWNSMEFRLSLATFDSNPSSRRPTSLCSASGFACAGFVRAYRPNLDSWRWQNMDPIEGRNRGIVGGYLRVEG